MKNWFKWKNCFFAVTNRGSCCGKVEAKATSKSQMETNYFGDRIDLFPFREMWKLEIDNFRVQPQSKEL